MNDLFIVNNDEFDFEDSGNGALAIRKDSKRIIKLNSSSFQILKLFNDCRSVSSVFEEWNNFPFEKKPDSDVFLQHFYGVFDSLLKERLICKE